MPSFLIRQAQSHEWPLVQLWLPLSFVALEESPVCVFVAVSPDGQVLGAATVRDMRDRHFEREGRFLIFVRPECRRQGIGTALMQDVYRLADAARMARVAAVDVVPDQADFLPFFEKQGMRIQASPTTFQFQAENFRRRLEPRYEFLAAASPRVRIDQVQSIYDLPARALAEFAVGEGGLVGWYESRLRDRYYCPHTSGCIQLEGRIVALLLTHSQPYTEPVNVAPDGSLLAMPALSSSQFTMYVDLMRVAPEHRAGSALVVLLMASVRRGMAAGGVAFAFESDEHCHPTMYHWGRRWNGAVIGRRFLFAIERDQWQPLLLPRNRP